MFSNQELNSIISGSNPDFNVEQMVTEIGMSRSKLYLKLKALT